jgi:hypothetical protein
MEIIPDSPDWDLSEDRSILKQFLDTRTGKRLIPKLLESCPVLLPSGDTNAIMIRSGEMRGVQIVINTLLSLVSPEATSDEVRGHEEYPSLTDDSAWPDPNKKQTPTQ